MTGGRSLQRQIDQAHQHVRQLRDDLAAAQAAELTAASWVHAGRNDGTLPRFFLLLDDMLSGRTRGVPCDASGTAIDGAAEVWLYRDAYGRPFGAEAGYWGVWRKDDGIWRFSQGRCPLAESPCDRLDSDIDLNSPPEASVNQEYTHAVTGINLAGPMQITCLPEPMTFDGDTGQFGGAPVTDGLFPVTISGYSEVNECPIVKRFTLVVTPCDIEDAAIEPGTPPEAAENVPFSHNITWTGLAEPPTLTGLPSGLVFDAGTGDIDGTIPIGDPITNQGTYIVIAKGRSATNLCPIEVRFEIQVGECDAGDASIDWGDPPLPPPPGQGGPSYSVTGDTLTIITPPGDAVFIWSVPIAHAGLEAPPELRTVLGLLDIEYDPETGMLTGHQRCLTIDLEFVGTSTEYECPVRRTLTLVLGGLGCDPPPPDCPDPFDHGELGAAITTTGGIAWDNGEANYYLIPTTNCTVTSVEGLPGYITFGGGALSRDADTGPGQVIIPITIVGIVTSGDHEGCEIRHDTLITIS